ncbi:YqeG family HAD IIIA-type phosphatase [Leuconostocaceae bacterium ESL0723]|nr:YqeG family HAD IIIA-type phosphatase [Lactobacillaceae bacterium L1_55_11]WEV54181.1 YqeG family HAD IIIA-type phosphatase [Leuconostocaceae bacterium ESL0723]
MPLEFLTPTYMVQSIYDLSVPELKAHGITTVLTDLDNTLLAWNNPEGTPELRQWLAELRQGGIELVVISNNTNKRVAKAVAPLQVDYVAWSLKPLPRGIDYVLKKHHLNPHEVIMVGDQLLTDVWAAHLAGVRSVLVKPLIESDMWQSWLNRRIEKQAKKVIFKEHPNLKWEKSLREHTNH